MQRSAILLVAILPASAWAGGPEGGAVLTPASVSHYPDDVAVTLGGTRLSPQCRIEWDTTGAEDTGQITCPTGSGLLLSSDASVDRSGVVAPGATYLGVCSDDAASPTECVTLSHDGTDAVLAQASGGLRLTAAAGSGTVNILENATIGRTNAGGAGTLQLQSALAGTSTLSYTDAVADHQWRWDGSVAEMRLALGTAGAVWPYILTTFANRALDHGRATAIDPVLYGWSARDPTGVGANDWWSLTHNQASPVLAWGLGMLTLSAPAGDESVRLPVIDAAVPVEPHACDATHTGAAVWVNDNDDGAASEICVCGKPNDVPTYDWLDTAGTTCNFF